MVIVVVVVAAPVVAVYLALMNICRAPHASVPAKSAQLA